MSQQQFQAEVMDQYQKEYERCERIFESGKWDVQYQEYLMKYSDKPICNGDMLIDLAESQYMAEDFIESMMEV